jgi:tetratricopeptide (TPR) repeat protein
MAGIVAVILALTAGIVATTREALRARRAERLAGARAVEAGEQRQRAEAQSIISDHERKRAEAEETRASAAATVAAAERDRAKSRLQDIRRLAGSFLFEFHDGIKDLPGSMAARELVVKRALEYLGRLSREPDQDVDLRRELAEAYFRIADIQGHPFSASLGRSADALVSYRKARDIFESIARDSPNDRGRALNMTGVVSERMGQVMARMGNTAAGLKEEERATKVFTMTAKEQPGNRAWQRNLSVAHQNLGDFFLRMGDTAAAMREYRTMQQNCLRLLAKDPANTEYRRDLAYSYQKIGDLLFFRRGEIDGAALEYQKLVDIRRPLAAQDPNNFFLKRELLMALERLGAVSASQKSFSQALEYLGQAQQIARDLGAADAKNVVVKRDLMSITHQLSNAQQLMGRIDEAIATVGEALATGRELLAINPKAAQYRADLAELEYFRAELLSQKSDLDGAQAGYEISGATLEVLTKEDAQNVSYKELLAIVYQAMGNLAHKRQPGGAEACQRYRQAADLFAAVGPRLSAAHTTTAKEVEQLVQECSAK